MSAAPPKIFISAGEASGDRLGAGLARALLERRGDLELLGMGGRRMRDAGVRVIQDSSEVAVVGIFEVLSHLSVIRRAMARLEQTIASERPDLLVPIDFPDFNLRLTARARKVGVEVVYYVSPQVWAWRRGRVWKIRELVRRMLVLFPFEPRFYEEAGVPVTFVGHPVVDVDLDETTLEELRSRAGLVPGRPTVALMPGSRQGELRRLLPTMIESAAMIRERVQRAQFLIPLAPELPVDPVMTEVGRHGLAEVRVHRGDFPAVLKLCTAGVVASGTASLEAAVAGLPIVVVYRLNALTYAVSRMLVKVDDVALPNLVAGRRVVPELIQADCTPERIAAEIVPLLEDPARLAQSKKDLSEVRERLGGEGAFDRAADAILEELDAVRG